MKPSSFLLLLAAALTLAACGKKEGAANGPQAAASAPRPALTVTVARPERQNLTREITANGNIAAWQEASVGADVSGLRLADVRVNVGDVVKKGQVLANFDAAPVQQDQAQARASLAEAEAAYADARGNAERARAVQSSGALSQQQINQYVTAEKTARARVEAARAVVGSQAIRVRNTQVLAPDAGVISARAATVGQVVAPGTELFRMVRQGRLEWRGEVMVKTCPPSTPASRCASTCPARPMPMAPSSPAPCGNWRPPSTPRRALPSSTSICRAAARRAPACLRAGASPSARAMRSRCRKTPSSCATVLPTC